MVNKQQRVHMKQDARHRLIAHERLEMLGLCQSGNNIIVEASGSLVFLESDCLLTNRITRPKFHPGENIVLSSMM